MIFITSSVSWKNVMYVKMGIELHEEFNGIGGVTLALFTSPADPTTKFGRGGATRCKYAQWSRQSLTVTLPTSKHKDH